jgi:hypothetical protein
VQFHARDTRLHDHSADATTHSIRCMKTFALIDLLLGCQCRAAGAGEEADATTLPCDVEVSTP